MTDDQEGLAEAVRAACVQAALDAYEDAGIRGLCHKGRWEIAVEAIRTLDLDAVIRSACKDEANQKND